MGVKQIVPTYTGRSFIDHCTTTLGIKETMLAALLNVTERTLTNWADQTSDTSQTSKFKRLEAFYNIVCNAEKEGLKGRVIINLLNEPIPNDKDERTLLYYVVEDPDNSLLATVALQAIRSFKQ